MAPPPVEAANPTPKPRLRVFFLPYFATGHMIPLLDVARLFAARGVESTILITPANAAAVNLAGAGDNLPIHIITYPFPSAEVGLLPGQENLSSVSPSDTEKIDAALPLVAPHHDRLLRLHRPDAIVSDSHFPWTTSIAGDLGVPRITFHAIGLFPVSVMSRLLKLGVSGDDGGDENEPFLVPDLPHPIHMTRAELPEFIRHKTLIADAMQAICDAENGSFGAVVNSFDAVDGEYAERYRRESGLRTWLVGPVSLAATGGRAAPAANRAAVLRWLDGKPAGSVLYAAFGSWCFFSDKQLRELALGLEQSGHPFVWVVRYEPGSGAGEWMPKGGIVVRGWAPQVEVLGHNAVGGFMTHCGWNSVLEGLAAGVPAVTWPLSTEQFISEKFLVTVLGTAVRVWEGFRGTAGAAAEKKGVVVPASAVAAAVRRVMGGDGEAEERRRRAKGFGEEARKAVEEGGSSFVGMTRLIEDIEAWKKNGDGGCAEKKKKVVAVEEEVALAS